MQRTHTAVDAELCGRPRELGDGSAVVDFVATPRMRADEHDLVHGGFVFGLADYAAMLAINHPNVVLGSANFRFERPVVVGDRLSAHARLRSTEGKKQQVDVEVRRDEEVVMRGQLTCFTPTKHVLESDERGNP